MTSWFALVQYQFSFLSPLRKSAGASFGPSCCSATRQLAPAQLIRVQLSYGSHEKRSLHHAASSAYLLQAHMCAASCASPAPFAEDEHAQRLLSHRQLLASWTHATSDHIRTVCDVTCLGAHRLLCRVRDTVQKHQRAHEACPPIPQGSNLDWHSKEHDEAPVVQYLAEWKQRHPKFGQMGRPVLAAGDYVSYLFRDDEDRSCLEDGVVVSQVWHEQEFHPVIAHSRLEMYRIETILQVPFQALKVDLFVDDMDTDTFRTLYGREMLVSDITLDSQVEALAHYEFSFSSDGDAAEQLDQTHGIS
eukprot:TRINITY_DN122034_c0_g1_i1.p2 TRINITY_DN122034_c0_g1~~TRINITY_DN122034_c0_g1_i1.p2  ORF type:complete len:304 (-),score=25.92 TRINITY_DN122034_c0_g1_i1:186-1097(-)